MWDGGGDGVLNSNHRGTGKGKMSGNLGERVPRVSLGIPIFEGGGVKNQGKADDTYRSISSEIGEGWARQK